MNITQARKIRRENRFGYFQFEATEMYERCPLCAQDVKTYVVAWASQPTRAQERTRSMIEHLMEEH